MTPTTTATGDQSSPNNLGFEAQDERPRAPITPTTSTTVALKITPGVSITRDVDNLSVLVSAVTPPGEKRTPSDICCVIDVSFSMSMEATVQTADGSKRESNGLSMLDIAKHAVRTVIHTLEAKDRLSMVTFSRGATMVLPLTAMDDGGKRCAEEKLDDLGFGPGTNLWRGLRLSLEALRDGQSQDRFAHIMLLTDGETEEKETVLTNLKEYKMKYERLPCSIQCFGFGYEIDSALLVEIASFSDGSYAFIPDAGLVGTVFVNTMSNLLVTMARDSVLTLQAEAGASIKEVVGCDYTTSSDGVTIVNVGSLRYGQSQDIVLQMSAKRTTESYLVASLEFDTVEGKQAIMAEAESTGHRKGDVEAVEWHRCRSFFVKKLSEAMAKAGDNKAEAVKAGHAIVNAAAAEVSASPHAADEKISALLEDILGQCIEAFSCMDYWQRWGRHYTPSLMLAHKLELCNNFKDPGVQFYGGSLFEKIRDLADDAFNQLDPPTITPSKYRYLGNGKMILNQSNLKMGSPSGNFPVPAARLSMASYNDKYGGCIDGSSKALLTSGELRQVSLLVKGDRIVTGDGAVAEIQCVVRTRCESRRAGLVELPGGARLTPHHPVQAAGAWRFPVDLAPIKEVPCEALYSFVLDGASSLVVGNIPCIALGHGLDGGAAKHPYFGSKQVLKDLAAFPSFKDGLIELPLGSVVRDPETGIVCGLTPSAVAA